MRFPRRNFLGMAAGASAFSIVRAADGSTAPPSDAELNQAAAKPVLQLERLDAPVIIDSIDVLRKGRACFLRVRSRDGAEGVSLDNGRMDIIHPILSRLVVPFFLGQDARDLEQLLFGVYRHSSNYKLQGLTLWCSVALVEFAILDMLGRITGQSIGTLLGGVVRESVPFYVASGRRDTTPPQEIEYLQSLIHQTGAKAVKYRVGGRMSRNQDAMPRRTAQLIPLSRKALGDQIAIHADANSSYDPPHAIEVGRMLEEIGALHFEEPCPFDDFDATKRVTEALEIPIALGEQESSQWRFQWVIRERVADIVQPDLYYYGGLVRSRQVARMADLCAMPTTVHLSGGFGFVYSLHFAAATPNIGPWQEYKGGVDTYGPWFDPPLRATDGTLNVPTGPGLGLADPQAILRGAAILGG